MKSRRKGINLFRLVLVFMVGYFLYTCVSQQLQLYAIQRETTAAKVKLEQAAQTKESLTVEKGKLGTNSYVEKVAREELGLVKPGEVPYVSENKKN